MLMQGRWAQASTGVSTGAGTVRGGFGGWWDLARLDPCGQRRLCQGRPMGHHRGLDGWAGARVHWDCGTLRGFGRRGAQARALHSHTKIPNMLEAGTDGCQEFGSGNSALWMDCALSASWIVALALNLGVIVLARGTPLTGRTIESHQCGDWRQEGSLAYRVEDWGFLVCSREPSLGNSR